MIRKDIQQVPALMKKMNLSDDDKKLYSKTKKRNHYAKQDMLRTVRKQFATDEQDPDFVEKFNTVVTKYAKMTEAVKQKSLASVLTKQRS